MIPLSCSLMGQSQRVVLDPTSRVAAIYGQTETVEDFFCNYGLNPVYRSMLEEAGMKVVGTDDVGDVRVVELTTHPFYVATLYCFQTRSTARTPHPLVARFVASAEHREGRSAKGDGDGSS